MDPGNGLSGRSRPGWPPGIEEGNKKRTKNVDERACVPFPGSRLVVHRTRCRGKLTTLAPPTRLGSRAAQGTTRVKPAPGDCGPAERSDPPASGIGSDVPPIPP